MPDYMASADDEMICMITIEHVEAVNRIDEIMATPGIDVAVIGPGDLATSIDKRGQMDDPEVLALMARAEAGILKSGVPIGGVARTADQANAMIDRGYLRDRARFRLVAVPARHHGGFRGDQALNEPIAPCRGTAALLGSARSREEAS